MVDLGSDVALTENILKQKDFFNPSQLTSLIRDGEVITRATQRGSDGSTTVFTVPADKVLFVISISLNGQNSDKSSTGVALATIDSTASDRRLLQLDFGFAAESGLFTSSVQSNVVHNYSVPLRIDAGRSIILNLSGGASLIVSLCFQAYLLPKNLASKI